MNLVLFAALLHATALPQLVLQCRVESTGPAKSLATVTTKPDRYTVRHGEALGITLTIKAGVRGAYLPNYFAAWVDTCQAGFSVDLVTLDNVHASTDVHGCAGSILGPGPSAKELLKEYIFLRPGEERSWHTTLSDLPKSPGNYKLEAEYLSAKYRIDEVASLPEVHNLMVVGRVAAQPVPIRIR